MPSKAIMKAKAKRLLEIGESLAAGDSYGQVQATFAKKCNLTERQVRRDIEQVRTQWAEDAESEGKGDVRRNQLRHKLDKRRVKARSVSMREFKRHPLYPRYWYKIKAIELDKDGHEVFVSVSVRWKKDGEKSQQVFQTIVLRRRR